MPDNTIPAPMLANPARVSDLPGLCMNDRFYLSQKVDGRRLMVIVRDSTLRGVNRDGKPTDIPKAVRASLQNCPIDVVFDGELLPGSVFWIFDAPQISTLVTPATPLRQRLAALETIYQHCGIASEHVRLLPWAADRESKLLLAKSAVEARAEGLMAKDSDGVYTYGRRTSAMLKIKFVKEVDAVVTDFGRDGHDNMTLTVHDDDGKPVEIGEVTRQAGDGAHVRLGDVVTVKYLSWSGSRLVQPTLPRIRNDKRPEECLFSQLVAGQTKHVLVP